MIRPDRDYHIAYHPNEYEITESDMKLWTLGDSNHQKSEVSKLATNYDINSIMQYQEFGGFKSITKELSRERKYFHLNP